MVSQIDGRMGRLLEAVVLVFTTILITRGSPHEEIKNFFGPVGLISGLHKSSTYSEMKYEMERPNSRDVIYRTNSHDDVDTQSSNLNYEYCKLGGHLEHLSLHCKSEKLVTLQKAIKDADQPPDIQMIAMIVSAIATGCPKTALFLSSLLTEKKPTNVACDKSLLNGPEEKQSVPCNEEAAKSVERLFAQRMRIQFETLSTSLFLSLGCHDLGMPSGVRLLGDIRNGAYKGDVRLAFEQKQKDNTDDLILSYVNNHKGDAYNIPDIDEFVESPITTITENSTHLNRIKRTTVVSNEHYFTIKKSCKIILPLGETLYLKPKAECLQLCIDEDSCQSVGYTNDGSQTCQLNTETMQEVGSFFSCRSDDSKVWDYFEKKKDINYFIISSKSNGKVFGATPEKTVRLVSFTGDDNQYWFWKDDAIISKKYTSMALQYLPGMLPARRALLSLSSYRGVRSQRWNFQDETLIFQHDNSRLDINNAHGDASLTLSMHSSQKWSLSLDRFYFIILGRQSGKVLDISEADCSKGVIYLWEYHGGDNQLWYWDDENIRSKKCPDKVIDLHVSDFVRNGWGKVYMHYFHGGDNQKWKMEKHNFVSQFRDLRLDVRHGNTADGAAVGCHANNGGFNQQWNINTAINYFFILNKKTGRVMDASSPTEIKQYHYHYGDNQLWFWDGDVIRSKKYTNRVIDLHVFEFQSMNWGRIYLHTFHGDSNQRWRFADEYIISDYNSLYVEVQRGSYTDGSLIGAKKLRNQNWNLIPAHDCFTITSRMHAKVVDASNRYASRGVVHMITYHGHDNQLWFWDGDSLRSKAYPEKVLDYTYVSKDRGKVYLNHYNGGVDQRWKVVGDLLISSPTQLSLDITNGDTREDALVCARPSSGNIHQKWSFNSKERIYFIIQELHGKRVFGVARDLNIVLLFYHGDDNQLWFWDKDSIRSKKYPDKVVDLHVYEYGRTSWGRIYMHTYHGGENQRWKMDEDYITSDYRNLHLDVYKGNRIAGHKGNGGKNQKWKMTLPPTGRGGSCVDKTEKAIYNVVQWIPLVSTLWDLGSSIGYAAAGCGSVAEERAISMGIGLVMDVATAATLGTASAVTTGIKTGLKQGMKTTIAVTKHSIQNAFKKSIANVGEKGLQNAIKTGIKKSGKLIIRETVVDPALFLKNVGKISKNVLIHPKRTLKQSWKIAATNIDNLKQLGKKMEKEESSKIGNADQPRCKRTFSFLCFLFKNPKGYSETQRKTYKALLTENPQSETIDHCAKRYMSIKGNSFEREISSAPAHVKTKMNQLNTELEKSELFAVYDYTISPDVNMFTDPILNGKTIVEGAPQDLLKSLEKQTDEFSYQAALMQNYIKKNAISRPQTVIRYEQLSKWGHVYENNGVYTSTRFMSTTKKMERFSDFGLDLENKNKYNMELTIHLKKSGADISDLSHYPEQEEILIPVNTKFSVERSDPVDGITKITLTEI